MTEGRKTKVVKMEIPEKVEKEELREEEQEYRSVDAEHREEDAVEAESAPADRVETADDDEVRAPGDEARDAEEGEGDEASGDTRCEASRGEEAHAGEEEEPRSVEREKDHVFAIPEPHLKGECGMRVVHRNYSFLGIAGRASGSHVLISDPAGDVHKAVPMDILGRRVILVHRAEHSDYENAPFTDEPMG